MASSSSRPRPSSPPSTLISPSSPPSPSVSPNSSPPSPLVSPNSSPPSPPVSPNSSPPTPSYSPPDSPSWSPSTSPPWSPPRDPSAPLRNPYIDPSLPPPPPNQATYYEQIAQKRRRITKDASILHGFELRPTATSLLESNDVESLQNLIHEFTQTPKKKKHSKTLIFDSLAFHYPNSFSFKLVKLLSLQPPFPIRNVVVSLLNKTLTETHGDNMRRIDVSMLAELKNPLLESFKIETEKSLLDPLSKIIDNVAARIYQFPVGGWEELLEYAVSCISISDDDDDNLELKQRKGLMLLADLPIDCVENTEFWKNHFSALYENMVLLVDAHNENLQELIYDALLTLVGMSVSLGEIEIGASLLPILLEFINEDVEEETLLQMVRDFAEFISLDVGEILKGKEGDVFQCMLQIAEIKGSSEDLKCAAIRVLKELDESNMDTMEKLIAGLSNVDILRVLKVSLDMMACIKDDPLWFELDIRESVEAGISVCCKLGKFLLNWLSFEGNANVVVPMAIELIKTTHAASNDWKKRHAGMIVITTFGEGHKNDIGKYFEDVERLLTALLNDGHPRVLWVAMNAIKCLSDCKVIPHVQYHVKFFAKLITIIKTSLCPQVQAQAVVVIRSLVTNCRLDKMTSFGEEIVTVMLELLKHDKQKLQEEAVETLRSVAVLIPTNFRKYYDTTLESLEAILFHDYSIPKLLLRAKSLECMSSILLKVEVQKFTRQDAFKIMDSLISLEGNCSSTDYLVRIHILKALDQFCQCSLVVDIFIIKSMPMLLRSAQLDVDLKDNMPTNDSFDDNFLVENERVLALNVLSYCAVQSSQVFSPHIFRVSNIFGRWLGCSSSETKKASFSAVPNLLISVKSGLKHELNQRILPITIVQSLVEALHKETDNSMYLKMLKTLAKCTQISGSVFHSKLIKKIADEINHILRARSRNIIERERAQEAGNSEGGSEYSLDEEMIQDAKLLITAMIETSNKYVLLPYVDDLLSSAALLWGNDSPDRLKAIAVSIFNVLVPHFPDKLQTYHDLYTYTLLKACRNDSSHAQLETVRGIGICAQFGGENFKTIVNVAISWLYSVIEYGLSIRGEESGDGAKICGDMAVSVLGKICEFHHVNIDRPETKIRWLLADASISLPHLDWHSKAGLREQDIGSIRCSVVRGWLNFLPLTSDLNEAKVVHGQLSKMLKRSDPDVLGPNKENLPMIIQILRKILLRNEELATEETFSEIIEFLDKHEKMGA